MPLPRFVDYSLRFIAPFSLSLAIYYHYQSVQERVPAYHVSPTRARIVDTSIPAPPQMRVLYKGKDLNANVSAAVVYFWNDGKLPIKAEDVLEPLKIELDPASEIIDARILKVSRGITKFAKGEVDETAKNVLPLSFVILEHNDGAMLQIIYTGQPDAHISVSGVVVGAAHPREIKSDQDRPPARKSRFESASLILGVALGMVILTWTAVRRYLYLTEERTGNRADKFILASMLLGVALPSGLAGGYILWRSQPVVPSTIWTESQK